MRRGKCITTSRDAHRRPRRRRHRTRRTPRTRFRTAHMSRRCPRACRPRRHDVAEPHAPARVLHMAAQAHGLGFIPLICICAHLVGRLLKRHLLCPDGVGACDMLDRLEHALGHAAQERTSPLHEHGVERPENESSTTARTSTASSGQSRHTPRPSSHSCPLNVRYPPKGTVRMSSQIRLGMPWDERHVAMDNLIPRSRLRSSVRAAKSDTAWA